MTAPYDPNQVVTDGPFIAPRIYQHILKVLTTLALYAVARDGLHLAPFIAAILVSPVFMVVITVKEWYWPSDVNEHSYSFTLRADDFITDSACTVPALVLACTASYRWLAGALVLAAAVIAYRETRHNARP